MIRREQKRTAEVQAIRQALTEGEARGEPQPFEAARLKQGMLRSDAA